MLDDTMFDFEQPPRKIGKLVWTCNCMTPKKVTGKQIFSKMYKTEVNAENICIYCGYYALKMEEDVLQMNHQKGKFFRQTNYKKKK